MRLPPVVLMSVAVSACVSSGEQQGRPVPPANLGRPKQRRPPFRRRDQYPSTRDA